jgi:hypothetical protein
LTPALVRSLREKLGQLRLSLYEDNDWRERVRLLVGEGVRCGVNWLMTPTRLPALEQTVLELCALGCRDVLLLSYNGRDAALHLDAAQTAELERRVGVLARALGSRCALKLDVCWGERLEAVPRLFGGQRGDDCGAGADFVALTSDKRWKPCSFHRVGVPIEGAEDVLRLWREQRHLRSSAEDPGCARLAGHGLSWERAEARAR